MSPKTYEVRNDEIDEYWSIYNDIQLAMLVTGEVTFTNVTDSKLNLIVTAFIEFINKTDIDDESEVWRSHNHKEQTYTIVRH